MEHETGAPLTPDGQRDRHLTGGEVAGGDVIGADAPGRGNGRRRGLAIAVGAVVLVGGGGAAALAATTAPTPKPPAQTQTAPHGEGPAGEAPGAPGGPRGGGRGLFALGGALHGQLTVPGSGSTYENVLVQRGAVTAVSSTSLSVRSADGYAHTYAINAATTVDGVTGAVSALKTGDSVGVLAGSDSTARMVVKAGARGHRMPPGAMPGGEGFGGNGTPPWSGRLPGQGLRGQTPGPGQATPGARMPGTAAAPSAGGSST